MYLNAAAVYVGEVDGVPMVALGEPEDGSERSVIIMGGDDSLGRYCISTENGATTYEPLVGWEYGSGILVLRLAHVKAEELGLPEIVEIAIPDDRTDAIRLEMERLTGILPHVTFTDAD